MDGEQTPFDLLTLLQDLNSMYFWGVPMILLLVGTGLFLSIRLGIIQFRCLWHAINCVRGKFDDPEDDGDVSHFRALCAALSATIGVGNIAGVAAAIAVGGPGAVFWMWVTALVGMATKFASCSLAVKYRRLNPNGTVSGGPMYILSMGLKSKRLGAILGLLFALFGVLASFGAGNMVQANSVIDGLKSITPDAWSATQDYLGGRLTSSPLAVIGGLILSVMVGLVILGGFRRIAHVASFIVPGMCILYVGSVVVILVTNVESIIPAFQMIIKYAFTPYAAGGGVVGMTVAMTIQTGVARGIFSNESGLGSAPIAHAAVKTAEPIREGMVAMLGPLVDTLIICTLTALAILVTDAHLVQDADTGILLTGAQLTTQAFQLGLSDKGQWIVGISLVFFAFSTTIAWSYYGDRCTEYLLGSWAIPLYRVVYVLCIFVGANMQLSIVWALADMFNAMMAVPNLVGLVLLSGVVATDTKDYVQRLRAGAFNDYGTKSG